MSRWPRGSVVFAGLSLALIVGASGLLAARERAEIDVVMARLALVASLRSAAVEVELEAAGADAVVWSSFGDLRARVDDLARDWRALGPDAGSTLQRIYVTDSPHPDGSRQLLMDAGDGSAYSAHHREFQPNVDEFLAAHDYYDLFLVLPGGEVAYTYFKEEDFATNLVEGPWRDSGLADAVRTALTLETGGVAFSEFAPYAPSDGVWSAFVASPVQLADGRSGAMAFQIIPQRIGERLESITGSRGTATTTLVGPALTILGEEPWSRPTGGDPESLGRQVLLRVGQGEELGSATMVDPDGTRWAVAWEVTPLGSDRYVTLAQAEMAGLTASFSAGRRTSLFVTFLLWVALGSLTLGSLGRFTLDRHEL